LAGWPFGLSTGDPHILQNLIPGALSVPQEVQVAPDAISEVDFFTRC